MAKLQISELVMIALCVSIFMPTNIDAKPTPHGSAIRTNGLAPTQSEMFSIEDVYRLNELWQSMIQQPGLRFAIEQLKLNPSTTESLFIELAKSKQPIQITKNFSISGLPPQSIDNESHQTSESCMELVGNIQTLIYTYRDYKRSHSQMKVSEQYLRNIDQGEQDNIKYRKRNAQIELESIGRANTEIRNKLINLTNPKAVRSLDLELESNKGDSR